MALLCVTFVVVVVAEAIWHRREWEINNPIDVDDPTTPTLMKQ
jgi:hypothetical protein